MFYCKQYQTNQHGKIKVIYQYVLLQTISNKPTWKDPEKQYATNIMVIQYVSGRNKVKSLLRIDKIYLEWGIIFQSKNPNAFWAHTMQKLETKRGVAPLLTPKIRIPWI